MVVWHAVSCRKLWLFRVTLSVLGLSGPATDSFQGMPRKADLDEGGLAHFLVPFTKSMFRPLHHTSERRE